MQLDTTEQRLSPVTFDPTKQYDVDFKLVLLGYTGVGKTAIIRNFIESKSFDESCGTVATIGGCFSSVIVSYRGKDVLMKCWDTGGQERHLALTASYYRGAAVAFIVFSWTDRHSWDGELASVKYWIDELKKNNPQCKIILLGNKHDRIDPSSPVICEEEVASFCEAQRLEPCIKTSAQSGIGVHTAFRRAIEVFLDSKQIPLGRDDYREESSEPEALPNDDVPMKKKCC